MPCKDYIMIHEVTLWDINSKLGDKTLQMSNLKSLLQDLMSHYDSVHCTLKFAIM